MSRLRDLAKRNDIPAIGDIRNLGAMIAFELVTSHGGNEPDPDAAKALCAKALDNGLVLLSCGVFGNVIRILAPLTADDAIIDEGLAIIEKSLVEMVSARAAA